MITETPDTQSWMRFALAVTTVAGLMACMVWGLKYVALRGWIRPIGSRSKRLQLIEELPLDARRRLILVRCDGKDHLVLLGAGQDSVLVTNLSPPEAPPTATP